MDKTRAEREQKEAEDRMMREDPLLSALWGRPDAGEPHDPDPAGETHHHQPSEMNRDPTGALLLPILHDLYRKHALIERELRLLREYVGAAPDVDGTSFRRGFLAPLPDAGHPKNFAGVAKPADPLECIDVDEPFIVPNGNFIRSPADAEQSADAAEPEQRADADPAAALPPPISRVPVSEAVFAVDRLVAALERDPKLVSVLVTRAGVLVVVMLIHGSRGEMFLEELKLKLPPKCDMLKMCVLKRFPKTDFGPPVHLKDGCWCGNWNC